MPEIAYTTISKTDNILRLNWSNNYVVFQKKKKKKHSHNDCSSLCLLGLFVCWFVSKQPWAWICHPVFEPGPLVDRCSDAKLGTWPGLAKKGASEIRPAQIPNDKSHLHHCPYQNPTNPFQCTVCSSGEILDILLAAVNRELVLRYDSSNQSTYPPASIYHRPSCPRTPPSW